MSKTTMDLATATKLAEQIVAELAPGCERIEIAGSVRRRKPSVGDLEVVAISRQRFDLLGDPCGNELDGILDGLVLARRMSRVKGGAKYKQFALPHGINLDLFLTTPEQWGIIFLIRTGPADFSQRFVTQKAKGGLLPNELHVEGGRLWRGCVAVPTPEEADAFAAAGLDYLEPWQRS